jgi:Domain of unknown function (DUF6265)
MRKFLLLLPALLWHMIILCQYSESTFQQLVKLNGRWVMQTDKVTITEQWLQKNKTEYLGKSWTSKGKDSTLNETLLLSYENGVIKYTSTVVGENDGQAISFVLTKAENDMYVFENPQHDFPKRITYHFKSNNELIASIDNGKETGDNKIMFNYFRIPE